MDAKLLELWERARGSRFAMLTTRDVDGSQTARPMTLAQKEFDGSPLMKAYFPAGKDDPDLVLVRIDVYKAEYWDVKESQPVQLFKMAKAIAKGERAHDLGEHATITM